MSFFYTDRDDKVQNMGDGTSQRGRFKDALLPGYVKVYDKTIPELLVFISRYAKLINFYNSNNDLDGDWQSFFEKDEAVTLAMIFETETRSISDDYDRILDSLNSKLARNRTQDLQELFDLIYSIASKIDGWYKLFNRFLYNSEFKVEMDNAIEHLSHFLVQLNAYALAAKSADGLGVEIRFDLSNFHKKWKFDELGEADNIFASGKSQSAKITAAVPFISDIFNEVYKTFTYLVQFSTTSLRNVVNTRNDHSPHIALYIAFLKLLEHANDHLNEITKRHLDFYFNEVLMNQRKRATPDHVHVFFNLKPQMPRTTLEIGTRIVAGTDGNDKPIVFETEDDLQISQAQLASFKTLYVSEYPVIYLQDQDEHLQANNIYAAPVANSKDGEGEPFDETTRSWPLFGEDQFEKSAEERNMEDADLGFVVSAPVLNLIEGDRVIEIKLEFDKNSYIDFDDYINSYARAVEISPDNAFYRLISKAFQVSFTNVEGWIDYSKPDITPIIDEEKDEYAFLIKLKLKQDRESIDIYSPTVHGEKLQLEWPAIRFMLNNYATYNAYVALKMLVLKKVSIDVSVEGYRSLVVHNNVGPVNTDTPFQPFGPIPQLGSYFCFGDPRVINKYLRDLTMTIEWFDLPNSDAGFRGFYKDYGIDLNNQSFEIDISSISGNQYMPEVKDRQVFKLFQNRYQTEKDHSLSNFSYFRHLDLNRLPIKNGFEPRTDEFSAKPQEGYIRVALINPYTAFGHSMFPKVFSTIAMNNAANKNKKNQKDLPDPPYTPSIKSFEINYSARVSEELQSGINREEDDQSLKLVHLYPFGEHMFYPRKKDFTKQLLPQFDNGGNLFIGISQLDAPELLSILFQMLDVQHEDIQTPPPVQWSYMVEDVWKPMEKRNILSDTTNNLVSTGIVTIAIPADITDDNTVMEPGLFWLRAFVPGNLNVFCQVLDIRPHAVKAVRVMNEGADPYKLVTLSPGSVTGLEEDLNAIESVSQPFPSFDGKKGETETEFYVRVSERLNHKLRATTVTDFEKMVLSSFPNILIAKCIGRVNDEDKLVPGNNLQMIVMPYALRKAVVEVEIPKIEFSKLHEIRDYIVQHSSSFIRAEVSNPLYERIKVICSLKFVKNENVGHYIQKLNEEIRMFISPWLFDDASELRLGGYINKSEILTFIENRPYVKYVTRFSVIHIYKEESKTSDDILHKLEDTAEPHMATELIKASSPFAVLVPSSNHDIEVIAEESYISPALTSIGLMRIKDDLIIGEEKIRFRTEKQQPKEEALKPEVKSADDEEIYNFIIRHD